MRILNLGACAVSIPIFFYSLIGGDLLMCLLFGFNAIANFLFAFFWETPPPTLDDLMVKLRNNKEKRGGEKK